MHALTQWGGTTPVINILAIPSLQTHSTIIPQHFGAVCCVICWLLQWNMSPSLPSPPNSCIILLPISQFDRFSAFLLKSDDTQWYPMHMKHNRASRTLLRLIDGISVNCWGGDAKQPLLSPEAASEDPRTCAKFSCQTKALPLDSLSCNNL